MSEQNITFYLPCTRHLKNTKLQKYGLDHFKPGRPHIFPEKYVATVTDNLTTAEIEKRYSRDVTLVEKFQVEATMKHDIINDVLGTSAPLAVPSFTKKTERIYEKKITPTRRKVYDQNAKRHEEDIELYNKIAAAVAIRIMNMYTVIEFAAQISMTICKTDVCVIYCQFLCCRRLLLEEVWMTQSWIIHDLCITPSMEAVHILVTV